MAADFESKRKFLEAMRDYGHQGLRDTLSPEEEDPALAGGKLSTGSIEDMLAGGMLSTGSIEDMVTEDPLEAPEDDPLPADPSLEGTVPDVFASEIPPSEDEEALLLQQLLDEQVV